VDEFNPLQHNLVDLTYLEGLLLEQENEIRPMFHEFNPWKDNLVYLPSIEVILLGQDYENYVNKNYGGVHDLYIIKDGPEGFCCGVRYGRYDYEYLSPYVYPSTARLLWDIYEEVGFNKINKLNRDR